MGVYSVNESVAISRSRDKLRCLQLLARQGIGLPVTGFAHDRSIVFSSRKVIAEARAQWGVDHVLLCASHTHAGMAPRGLIDHSAERRPSDWHSKAASPWLSPGWFGIATAAWGTGFRNRSRAAPDCHHCPFQGSIPGHSIGHPAAASSGPQDGPADESTSPSPGHADLFRGVPAAFRRARRSGQTEVRWFGSGGRKEAVPQRAG